jgi:hypothetical protein
VRVPLRIQGDRRPHPATAMPQTCQAQARWKIQRLNTFTKFARAKINAAAI